MNLDQLEVVLTIAETGSFRAAAEKLNRSQPALSAAIKNLEEEFALQIFDRSEYRPKLTEAGSAFLAVARSALESAQYTARVGRELGKQKAETQLRISVDALISTEVLELIALECARPALPVNLVLEKSILDSGHRLLLDGGIDLAIGPRPAKTGGIEAIALQEVVLIGAVSRKLLQEKRRPTEAFLQKQPQILVYDHQPNEAGTPSTPQNKESGQKIFVPDHSTKLKLISGGVGWGRISQEELESDRALIAIEKALCPEVRLELCLLRPKLRPVGPTARAIWESFERRHKKR